MARALAATPRNPPKPTQPSAAKPTEMTASSHVCSPAIASTVLASAAITPVTADRAPRNAASACPTMGTQDTRSARTPAIPLTISQIFAIHWAIAFPQSSHHESASPSPQAPLMISIARSAAMSRSETARSMISF